MEIVIQDSLLFAKVSVSMKIRKINKKNERETITQKDQNLKNLNRKVDNKLTKKESLIPFNSGWQRRDQLWKWLEKCILKIQHMRQLNEKWSAINSGVKDNIDHSFLGGQFFC